MTGNREGLYFVLAPPTAVLETLTGALGGLTFDLDAPTGILDALTFNLGGLTFDLFTLIFDLFALTFILFRLNFDSNNLIDNHLRKRPSKCSQKATVLVADAEYCLRDVRATVELYKIWKERLAGIK